MFFCKLQVFTFDLFYANGCTISPLKAPNFSQTMQDNDFLHSICKYQNLFARMYYNGNNFLYPVY